MNAQSQNARILDVLSDGRPHTTAEIHQRAGFSRLNSRIAELRAQGYPIPPCERTGEGTGPETFVYRLLSERAVRGKSSTSGSYAATPILDARSDSSPTPVPLSAPGSALTESDVSRSAGPGTAVPRAPITEPTQLALEVAS